MLGQQTYVPQECNGVPEAPGCGSRIPVPDCTKGDDHEEFARIHCPAMCGMNCAKDGDVTGVDVDQSQATSLGLDQEELAADAEHTEVAQHVKRGQAAIIALLVIGFSVVAFIMHCQHAGSADQHHDAPVVARINNPMYDHNNPRGIGAVYVDTQGESTTDGAASRCPQCNAKVQFCSCNMKRSPSSRSAKMLANSAGDKGQDPPLTTSSNVLYDSVDGSVNTPVVDAATYDEVDAPVAYAEVAAEETNDSYVEISQEIGSNVSNGGN